jgi:hypothetical protein
MFKFKFKFEGRRVLQFSSPRPDARLASSHVRRLRASSSSTSYCSITRRYAPRASASKRSTCERTWLRIRLASTWPARTRRRGQQRALPNYDGRMATRIAWRRYACCRRHTTLTGRSSRTHSSRLGMMESRGTTGGVTAACGEGGAQRRMCLRTLCELRWRSRAPSRGALCATARWSVRTRGRSLRTRTASR